MTASSIRGLTASLTTTIAGGIEGIVKMSCAFRALGEIADETFEDDWWQWRGWYAAHDAEKLERFRTFDCERRLVFDYG